MNSLKIKTKDGVTYSHVSSIGRTILVPMFYKHLSELMEIGHCSLQTFENVTNSTKAIIAKIDDKLVGYDVFNHNIENKSMFDIFTYVDPDYRKRGIFTEIEMCLLKYAKDNKVDYIHSHVSVKNEASVHACRKLGFNLFISEDSPEYYEYVHSTY
jgi:RimJ/RimL family protein N-acetyltransferase